MCGSHAYVTLHSCQISLYCVKIKLWAFTGDSLGPFVQTRNCSCIKDMEGFVFHPYREHCGDHYYQTWLMRIWVEEQFSPYTFMHLFIKASFYVNAWEVLSHLFCLMVEINVFIITLLFNDVISLGKQSSSVQLIFDYFLSKAPKTKKTIKSKWLQHV